MSGNRAGKTEQSLSLLRALLTNRQVPDANRISITVGEVRALTGLRYTDWTSGEPVEKEWVVCPLCQEPEHPEDMVAGVCLSCADAIAYAQNARRGAIDVEVS